MWFFTTETFIGHFFYHFSSLIESTRDYHCVAASGFCYSKYLPHHYGEFFDGWSLYSPLQEAPAKKWESYWKTSYQDFLEDKAGGGLQVFTICPGFDDTGLTQSQRSRSKIRKIARSGTETYVRMQNACLDLRVQPDLVVITSFNEFHENTHIEPTKKYGDTYIETTRRFSEVLRSGEGRDPRETDSLAESNCSKYN